MPPTLTILEPANGRTYQTNQIPITVTEGHDVRKITYSIRDNTKNTWIVTNSTLLENVSPDSLTPPTKVRGPASIELPNGDYTLRIIASSMGYGYKAFVEPKKINHAMHEIRFTVNKPAETTTATPTTATPTTTATTAATTTTVIPGITTRPTPTRTTIPPTTPTQTTFQTTTTRIASEGGFDLTTTGIVIAAAALIVLAIVVIFVKRSRFPKQQV